MSTRALIEKEVASLPEALQREVVDFARFLRHKNADAHFNGLLSSESALAKAWNTSEEDKAWANLQPVALSLFHSRKPIFKSANAVRLWS